MSFFSFMFGDVAAGYLKKDDGTEVIGLPFEGEVFEMVIIVPEKGKSKLF